jgi:WD40 repeat protein
MLVWKAHSQKIEALAFSRDGRTLALAGGYLACRLIDSATGERLWTLTGSHSFCFSLTFLPDGSVLCKNGAAAVLDPKTGTEMCKFGSWCRAFAPAPGGRLVFVAESGYNLHQHNRDTGEVRRAKELESGPISRVAVSPDGKLVALVGCKQFFLLDADTLAVLASDAQRALSSGSFALAFSPCGQRLVYSAGRTLFVWNTTTRQEINRVHLDVKHFMDAAFTPDGKRLITVSKEGAARMWDTATWTCERAFAWDVGPLRAIAVSHDGTRAATAGDSGRVVVWDLE